MEVPEQSVEIELDPLEHSSLEVVVREGPQDRLMKKEP
jgi:hypothetical protein